LRGPYMMDRYDADLLAELLAAIRPDNALVTFSAQSVSGDRVSHFYQVPYAVSELDTGRLAVVGDDPGVAGMHLPLPNEFIAEDVSLVALPASVPSTPQIALEANRQTIWFMPDSEYRVPRGATYISFRSPRADGSALHAARVALYTQLLTDHVNEFAYPAQLAGMGFEFYPHSQGITLRVGGYTDKQKLLLQRLFADMVDPEFTPRRFDDIRAE